MSGGAGTGRGQPSQPSQQGEQADVRSDPEAKFIPELNGQARALADKPVRVERVDRSRAQVEEVQHSIDFRDPSFAAAKIRATHIDRPTSTVIIPSTTALPTAPATTGVADPRTLLIEPLLSFRSAVAASQWSSAYQQATLQDPNVRDSGSLTTVDGAFWYRGAYEGATGYLGTLFAKGAYGVVLRVFRPNATNHELLESLAKAQYDRLPS